MFVLTAVALQAATGAAAPDWPSRGSAARKTRGVSKLKVRVDLTIPHPYASCTHSFATTKLGIKVEGP